jgi:chorismate dehydratase
VIAKRPIEQARRIALDRSSRSTQTLVKILCADHWKITPDFFEAPPDAAAMLEEADAALLIGDPALRLSIAIESRAKPGGSGEQVCEGASAGVANIETLHVHDVAQEWRRMTDLPAVLAIWAARRDTVTPEVAADFLASKDYGMAHIAEICAQAERELGLAAAALESYLRDNIDFTLDDENRRGLEFYYQRAAELGLIERAKPFEWAEAKCEAVRVSSKP